MIIGITGRAGSGKDTVADMLLELIPGSVKRSFAGPLKDMALAVDPIIATDIDDDWVYLSELVSVHGWDLAKQHTQVRRFLQRLGTDGVRGTFGDDAWTNLLMDEYYLAENDGKTFIVPDTRFPNEAELVDVLIAVERLNAPDLGANANHLSEQPLPADITIYNWGTLDQLQYAVETDVMAAIRELT